MTDKIRFKHVYSDGHFSPRFISFDPSSDFDFARSLSESDDIFVFPGFADVHVHLREPGFSYKETIRTGTLAAAHGGYTSVCSMPNLDPVPDTADNLRKQLDIISKDAVINVFPYGAISIGEKGVETAHLEELAENAVAFSDDGKGVFGDEIMREAMLRTKALGKLIAAHCEDMSYVRGGYIREGNYSRAHGHKGILPESEFKMVERDISLLRETGASYHVCHVSTKQSLELIRAAKKEGLDITCETAPHYLLLTEDDLQEDGRFKMNPPLGSEEDRKALIEGILDGTVDMIATDHAPHSAAEKSAGLEKSLMGVVGLECAFQVLYTKLVRPGILPLERLIYLMAEAPRKRFSLRDTGIEGGNFSVWDLSQKTDVDPDKFLSMGRSTPFSGMKVYGKCKMTVFGGKTVWQDK